MCLTADKRRIYLCFKCLTVYMLNSSGYIMYVYIYVVQNQGISLFEAAARGDVGKVNKLNDAIYQDKVSRPGPGTSL